MEKSCFNWSAFLEKPLSTAKLNQKITEKLKETTIVEKLQTEFFTMGKIIAIT